MAQLLYRLGRFAYRRRGLVSIVWAVILGLLAIGALAMGGKTVDSFSIPGTESQTALDALAQDLPDAAGASLTIVVKAPEGNILTHTSMKRAVAAVVKKATALPDVVAVADPYSTERIDQTLTIGLISVSYQKDEDHLTKEDLDAFEDLAVGAAPKTLQVVPGGVASSAPEIGPIDAIGVLIAAGVLIITFGSLVAAGMTMLTALVGVGIGMSALLLITTVMEVSSTAPILALMLGLAVGIDYALFISSRHRTQVLDGMDLEESVAQATATAGSAVLFAGATVVIALAGLGLVGVPFLTTMGLAAAGTVMTAVAVALSLLPALLAYAGRKVLPRDRRRRALHAKTPPPSAGFVWAKWVTRWRLPVLGLCVVGLAVLAIPTKDLRLAIPTNGTAPAGSHQRVAYDLTTAAFGEGANGPLLVVIRGPRGDAVSALAARVTAGIGRLSDVVAVQPGPANQAGTTQVVVVIPASGPTTQATGDLVKEIREKIGVLDDGSTSIGVTGTTAVGIDVSEKMTAALPKYLIVVIGLSFLLLLLAFRSVLVPVKATVGFLLTIGATFGVVVAVFQWGWGSTLFGIDKAGPLVSFLPIIMLGILFGLAMDYEVFIVSRVREEFVHGGDPTAATQTGVGHGARVVTAAALIMSAVFGGFVLVEDPTIKTIGFGLSVGVLIDAFVVRMTLVPALLTLMGKAAWSFPGWLDRVTPHVDIEGTSLRLPQTFEEEQRRRELVSIR